MRRQVERQNKRTEEHHKWQEKNTAGAREKITDLRKKTQLKGALENSYQH